MSARLKALAVLAVLLAPFPAAAQGWKEYDYPEAGFTIQFPATPTMATGTYKTVTGVSVPARTYSAQVDQSTYTVTVADYAKTAADQANAVRDAVKAFAAAGEIKVDVEARINWEYGHELSVLGKDGGRSIVAIFFIDHRLYELVGRTAPPNPENGSGASIRFQQSLQFR